MILCRVVGNAVSTIKHPVYKGLAVMAVQPVGPDGSQALGQGFLAVDSVQAGQGDLVLCAREGNTARQLLGGSEDPFHAVILAVVDEVTHSDGYTTGPAPSDSNGEVS